MYTQLCHMFWPRMSQMTRYINQLMVDGKIPDTPEAEDAVRSLFKLRRPGPRRWIDSILVWDDVMFNQHPSEKIERRRRNVKAAKLECLDAEITAEVIDGFFPEGPTALQIAKKHSRLQDLDDGPVPELARYREIITPSAEQTEQAVQDILDDAATEPSKRPHRRGLIERFHLWRERSRASANGERIY